MQMPIAAMAAAMGAQCASAFKTACESASSRGSASRRQRLTRRAIFCILKGPMRSRSDVRFPALPRKARRLIALAPAVQRLEHRAERLSLVGQEIFVARRVAFVEAGGDHALAL